MKVIIDIDKLCLLTARDTLKRREMKLMDCKHNLVQKKDASVVLDLLGM